MWFFKYLRHSILPLTAIRFFISSKLLLFKPLELKNSSKSGSVLIQNNILRYVYLDNFKSIDFEITFSLTQFDEPNVKNFVIEKVMYQFHKKKIILYLG